MEIEDFFKIRENTSYQTNYLMNQKRIVLPKIIVDLSLQKIREGWTSVSIVRCPICNQKRLIERFFIARPLEKDIKTPVLIKIRSSEEITSPLQEDFIFRGKKSISFFSIGRPELNFTSDSCLFQNIVAIDNLGRVLKFNKDLALKTTEQDKVPHPDCLFSSEFFESIQEYRLDDYGDIQIYRLEPYNFDMELWKNFVVNISKNIPVSDHIINFDKTQVSMKRTIYDYQTYREELFLFYCGHRFKIESLDLPARFYDEGTYLFLFR